LVPVSAGVDGFASLIQPYVFVYMYA